MSKLPTQTTIAKKDAETISKFLKDNFSGELVSKASLRARFDLPVNRSVLVWEYLRIYGMDVEHNAIVVPQPQISHTA